MFFDDILQAIARPQLELYHVHGAQRPLMIPLLKEESQNYWLTDVPGAFPGPGIPGIFTYAYNFQQHRPGSTAYEEPFHMFPYNYVRGPPDAFPQTVVEPNEVLIRPAQIQDLIKLFSDRNPQNNIERPLIGI